jgi:hypothetical protein
MPILVTGNTYAANDQVTSTNLNAAVNSATFASGAVDDVSTQLSSGSIIVKDSGISPQKLDSTASYTVGSLTATSTVTTNSLNATSTVTTSSLNATSTVTTSSLNATSGITSAGIIVDIMQADLLKLVPETGYTTSGTIALNLSVASNARILLAGNSTFTVAGQAAGAVNIFALKNSTGSSITTTWPAWQAAGGSFPATLTAGQAMVFVLYSYGTGLSDVYAVSSL